MVFLASCLFLVFLGSSFAGNKYSRDYKARSIKVIGKSAKMHYHDVGLIFDKSGEVGSEGIPDIIQLGDFITVKDKTVQANIIEVSEYLQDLKYGGRVFGKKGQVTCMIAAREEDFPHGEMRDRVWIRVEHCQALK
jgi:hypothetical protein